MLSGIPEINFSTVFRAVKVNYLKQEHRWTRKKTAPQFTKELVEKYA